VLTIEVPSPWKVLLLFINYPRSVALRVTKPKRLLLPLKTDSQTMTVFIKNSKPEYSEGDWVFYAMDYFATGEGRTLMFLVEKGSNPELSVQDFINFCTPYYAPFIEKCTKQDFMQKYSSFLPPAMKSLFNGSVEAPTLRFLQEFHFNFG
jgi:hypothetical protein